MTSAAYELFYRSMAERKPVICIYQDHPRAICPIILGHTDGKEKALVYQFAGSSSQGSLAATGWKCLTLSEVRNAELHDGPWHGGEGSHATAQSCVRDVDVDINPASPYNPRRRLPPVPERRG